MYLAPYAESAWLSGRKEINVFDYDALARKIWCMLVRRVIFNGGVVLFCSKRLLKRLVLVAKRFGHGSKTPECVKCIFVDFALKTKHHKITNNHFKFDINYTRIDKCIRKTRTDGSFLSVSIY